MRFSRARRRYKTTILIALTVAIIVVSAFIISANKTGETQEDDFAPLALREVLASDALGTSHEALLSSGPMADADTLLSDLVMNGKAASDWVLQTFEVDADELLFGKIGKELKLHVTAPPNGTEEGWDFSSSDESVATVTTSGAVKAKGWGECVITVKDGDRKVKCKVTVAKKWVALTFDDGPGAPTKGLLKTLEKNDVRATFFVVGSMAKNRVSTLKEIAKKGNEIGNHTYNHRGAANVLKGELGKTDAIVREATGSSTSLMRPPGGAINNTTKSCGKAIIMWSVDPKDWRDRNANTVYKRVMEDTKSGSIVLLHDIHQTSADAAVRIIESLKDKGYAFVTVSELLGNPKAGKVYNDGPKKVRTMKIKY